MPILQIEGNRCGEVLGGQQIGAADSCLQFVNCGRERLYAALGPVPHLVSPSLGVLLLDYQPRHIS
jgi:hypothetical protein